jgi:hypothetical protein
MADSNLDTSLSAVSSAILSQIPTATIDELVNLSRAALQIGESENATIETAINARVNTLVSGATATELKKLGDVINRMKTTPVTTTADSGSSGPTAAVTTSDTAPSAPSDGDLWWNSSNGGLYLYYNDGSSTQWVSVRGATGPAGADGADGADGVGGGSSVTTSDTAPTSPNSGDQWFDTTSGTLYVYYNDGTSSQWIGVSGPSGADGADGVDGADASNPSPTITSISPTSYDGTTGTSITIIGTNFDIGTIVSFIDSGGNEYNASTTSVITQGELTAVTPQAFTAADGPLDLKVTTGGGQNTTTTDAIQTGGSPIWTTAAGQLGSSLYKDTIGVSLPIVATDPEGQFVSYTVNSGALVPGLSLGGGTGLITGDVTSASITATTNYSFTVNASDTSGNATPRTFFINVLNEFGTYFTRNSTYKWTYSQNVTRASELYTDLAANTDGAPEFRTNLLSDNTSATGDALKYAYGAYIKFNMLVGPSSTPKTVIGFVNRNSSNNNWSLSPFDYGDAPNIDNNYRNFMFINSNSSTSTTSDWSNTSNGNGRLIHLVSVDDNDCSFMRADGAAIIHGGQGATNQAEPTYVYQPNTDYSSNASNITAHAGATSVPTQAANWPGGGAAIGMHPWLQQVKASTSSPWAGISSYDVTNRQSSYSGYTGGNTDTQRFAVVSFMGIGGEVVFEYFGGNVAYYVSVILPNGYVHRFARQTITSPSNIPLVFTNNPNERNNTITSVNDGFSEAMMQKSDSSTGAITFNVNWTNGTLENVTNITLSTVNKIQTEEDIYGDPIHLVLGSPWFHKYYNNSPHGSTFLHSWADGIPLSNHENWKSTNNYGRWMGENIYTYYKSSSRVLHYSNAQGGQQTGLDLFSMIGPQNYVYLGDWGHDNEGMFGQSGIGQDSQFTFSRTNIRLIPSDWY